MAEGRRAAAEGTVAAEERDADAVRETAARCVVSRVAWGCLAPP